MQRTAFVMSLLLAAALPVTAEEIALKDGTKIVGHMTALAGDKIEVETAYGKMSLKRSDVVTISFPENGAATTATSATTGAPSKKDVMLSLDESLQGTQYVNRTAKFSLTLPPEWKINMAVGHSTPATVAGLSSKDDMRFLVVSREEYSGSLESYKGLGEIQIRRSLGNYESLLETPVTIDGKPSLMISYRGTLPKANDLPVQFLVAIVPSGTTFTKIATWCVEPLFHETQPMFERILTSYRSNGQPASSAQLSKP